MVRQLQMLSRRLSFSFTPFNFSIFILDIIICSCMYLAVYNTPLYNVLRIYLLNIKLYERYIRSQIWDRLWDDTITTYVRVYTKTYKPTSLFNPMYWIINESLVKWEKYIFRYIISKGWRGLLIYDILFYVLRSDSLGNAFYFSIVNWKFCFWCDL